VNGVSPEQDGEIESIVDAERLSVLRRQLAKPLAERSALARRELPIAQHHLHAARGRRGEQLLEPRQPQLESSALGVRDGDQHRRVHSAGLARGLTRC
jgi:hypothetical protein